MREDLGADEGGQNVLQSIQRPWKLLMEGTALVTLLGGNGIGNSSGGERPSQPFKAGMA